MTTPVSFPLAKLLNSVGFDKICYRAFLFKTYQPSNIYEENIKAIKNAENFSDSHYEKYYRPTIAEVVMWLYDKHGFWIWCDTNSSKKWIWTINIVAKDSFIQSDDLGISQNPYNSPTEAYEAAIEYCLTKLT